MEASNDIDRLRAKVDLLKTKSMSPEDEFAFRKEIMDHPELVASIREWDELEEAMLLSTASPLPQDLKKKTLGSLIQEEWKTQTSNRFPILHPASKKSDLKRFVKESQVQRELGNENFHVELLEQTEEVTSMLVHVKHELPSEVHTDLIEQFLLLQGECDVQLGEEVSHF